VKIIKLHHASIILERDGQRIAVDPGLHTPVPEAEKLAGTIAAVLVTHRHGDHFDPAVLRAIGAPVYGGPELSTLAETAGLTAHIVTFNTPMTIAGLTVTFVPADHGPGVTQRVENGGFVIADSRVRIYITGDMKGPQPAIDGVFDVIVAPIEGSRFVFSGGEAAAFIGALGHTGIGIGVHADENAEAAAAFKAGASGQAWTAWVPAVGETGEV
jgi:L-ascorbate metabolism protein UlaG (beta-lactamase superfamily)